MHLDSNWVGAIGQWAGAIGTVAAVWTALRISAKDGRQREQDRVDEARGRAAMVFTKDDGGSVVVANHSDRPVRDVAVRVGHPSEMLLQWSPSNPTGYVTDLLPPGMTAILRSSYEVVSASGDTRYPLNAAPKDSWIVLGFADVEGRRWVRVGDELPTWQREPVATKRTLRRPSWRWRRTRAIDSGRQVEATGRP